ncbi:MAG: transposase, partial [Thermoanaerobaculia bacterium]|nr:transposase [Thermoanaerobaculia bacterium]
TYILTAGTFHKDLLFSDTRRLDLLNDTIISIASSMSIDLQSWSVFANHYHLVAELPENLLRSFVQKLHSRSAIALNAIDGTQGRKVWLQYWDPLITNERSWLARMRYVIENLVRHGFVADASDYRWCSAAWSEATAHPSLFDSVMHFPIERVSVRDPFDSQLRNDEVDVRSGG